MDEIRNSHVNIDDKETKLLIIASIETFKRQNKKCCKDEVFALIKDFLEEAITMISLKSLELLQASHSIKCNIISNRTCLSIPKHSYKQLITNNYIESKESQNKNTPGCFCNNKKRKPEKANKNIAIVRSLDSSCNQQKTIIADDHKSDTPKGGKTEKFIFVIGDSMVEHLNEWEMSKKLNANWKMFVKAFSGAKTICMNDYVKPLVRSSPDHFTLHVGTNDLSSDKSPEEIAIIIIIMNLATSIKNEKLDVSISNIIIRADGKKLDEKRCKVNSFLGKLCKEKNYYLIVHFTRIKRNHLNKRKLHLNQKGTKFLSGIFVKELFKVFN